MTDGDWFTDAYEILGSDPGAINALAQQWEQLGTSLSTVKPVTIDSALTKAASSWSTGGPGLTAYGQQLGDHLTAMADTAQLVAAELRGYAEQLAKARSDIQQLLITILAAVGTSALVLAAPELLAGAGLIADAAGFGKTLANVIRPAGATTSVLSLIAAIRSYNSYADSLGKTLAGANQKLGALNTMGSMGAPQLPVSPS